MLSTSELGKPAGNLVNWETASLISGHREFFSASFHSSPNMFSSDNAEILNQL